jgi:adenylosuccinate lyase
LPQGFLAADAVLRLYLNVVPGLVVHQAAIARHVAAELPFMATENLLMAAVQAGGDRQDLHERIRTHSLAAADRVKEGDGHNDLLARLSGDPHFPAVDFAALMDERQFIGRAPEQVSAFVASDIAPIRRRFPDHRQAPPQIHV